MVSSEVKIDDKKVVDSGYVNAYQNEKIKIALTPDYEQLSLSDYEGGGDGLVFIFEFMETESDEADIELEPINETTAKYNIVNHIGGLSVGGVTPRKGPVERLDVGTLEGKRLELAYQVSGRNTESDEESIVDFFYTFYISGGPE